MIKNEISIDGRLCILYQDEAATHLLIQPIDEHDLELLDQEIEAIKKLSDKPFSLVAFMIKDWNQELTPWAAPDCCQKFKKTFLTSYLVATPLLVCLPYGLDIRQTSLMVLSLLLRQYGSPNGLNMQQITNHLQNPSISAWGIRRKRQRIQ